MEADADARAYDELSRHARIADLASIAARILTTAEELQRGEPASAEVDKLATERQLLRQDAESTFGNALDVLARGPADERERSLARALAAHALASQPFEAMDDERRAKTVLRLSARTPFDATSLLDRSLGEGAERVWQALPPAFAGPTWALRRPIGERRSSRPRRSPRRTVRSPRASPRRWPPRCTIPS